jgi:hypothetical protein
MARAGVLGLPRKCVCALQMRLVGADVEEVASSSGDHRRGVGDDVLRRRWSAERKRKQRRRRACPRGALAYPEAKRADAVAGEGRRSPKSKKNFTGDGEGNGDLCLISSLPIRFRE